VALDPGEADEAFARETESEPAADPEPGDPEDEAAAEAGGSPAREVSDGDLERELAALLLASADPLSPGRLRKLLGVGGARIETALAALGQRLAASGLPWELRAIAGGWQLYTTPDVAPAVAGLSRAGREERISPAALETLAVVAYRQPVTKAEIEAIRGVQAGPVLRSLVDRGLVRITGRADLPGQPLLYGTTKEFLERFGLSALGDLPRDGELNED
jgi:segregation and condensation protein B